MFTSKPTIRSLLAVITLAALTTMVSGLAFAIHLSANHTEHRRCCDEKHTQNEPTGKPEQQKQPNDQHSCPICQTLLDSSGKFICTDISSINPTSKQIISTAQVVSICFYQHQFSPAVPRGPPCC